MEGKVESQDNPVVYWVFTKMCELLKEEGVRQKEIAMDMEMDLSLFSKMVAGKRPITDHYKAKIFTYLSDAKFEIYKERLLREICSFYQISERSVWYWKMQAKDYQALLRYLFYEFQIEDLVLEKCFNQLYLERIYQELDRLLKGVVERKEKDWNFAVVRNERFKQFELEKGIEENCMMEVDCFYQEHFEQKICIVICPFGWNQETELVLRREEIGNPENFMFIHVRENEANDICSIREENMADSKAEIETLSLSRIYENADQLAHCIFQTITEELSKSLLSLS